MFRTCLLVFCACWSILGLASAQADGKKEQTEKLQRPHVRLTDLLTARSKVKLENRGGFRTAMDGRYFRAFWQSLKDQHKLKGLVSKHLPPDQLETIIMFDVNMHIALGRDGLGVQRELLAFLSKGNRFQTGPLPKSFDRDRPMKLLVGLFRTKKGDYGLITRYSKLTVVELNGRVGVAPVNLLARRPLKKIDGKR